MNVTYTLTWDEFAEPHQHTWPRVDAVSLVLTVAVALPLIAYGVALWRVSAPGIDIVYLTFIGAPLLLVVMALAHVQMTGRSAKKRAIAAKQADYERSHSGPQSFSFDQEKWTHENADGKQEIPWSALQTAGESPNTIYLEGKQIRTLVPKRLLDAATLESLRQLALPSGVGGESRIGAWDYLATQTSILWRKLWILLVPGNLFGLAVLAWVAVRFFAPGEKSGVLWGWGLACYFAVLALSAQLWYFLLRYATALKAFRAPTIFAFSARGVRIVSQIECSFVAWDILQKFRETRRAFLLFRNDSKFYLLVKDRIPAETQEQMRQILREKVKQE
jgi:hypothetical protein